MELTYTVRGADGKEYGPVSLQQLGNWIRERRLLAGQDVKRSDMQHWAKAADFEELQGLLDETGAIQATLDPSAGTAARQPAPVAATAAQVRSAGSWFYWIAGFGLVNVICDYTGAGFRFVVGLGVTNFLESEGIMGLLLAIGIAGFFVVLGVFASKGNMWAFITGTVLFGLDTVLSRTALSLGAHIVVLFFLIRGILALRKLRAE